MTNFRLDIEEHLQRFQSKSLVEFRPFSRPQTSVAPSPQYKTHIQGSLLMIGYEFGSVWSDPCHFTGSGSTQILNST